MECADSRIGCALGRRLTPDEVISAIKEHIQMKTNSEVRIQICCRFSSGYLHAIQVVQAGILPVVNFFVNPDMDRLVILLTQRDQTTPEVCPIYRFAFSSQAFEMIDHLEFKVIFGESLLNVEPSIRSIYKVFDLLDTDLSGRIEMAGAFGHLSHLCVFDLHDVHHVSWDPYKATHAHLMYLLHLCLR